MVRKNDLAFVAGRKVLVISEHQATINENMPLRDVIYYGRTIEKLIEPRALYRTNGLHFRFQNSLYFITEPESIQQKKS